MDDDPGGPSRPGETPDIQGPTAYRRVSYSNHRPKIGSPMLGSANRMRSVMARPETRGAGSPDRIFDVGSQRLMFQNSQRSRPSPPLASCSTVTRVIDPDAPRRLAPAATSARACARVLTP